MLSRRDFLKSAAAISAATLLPNLLLAGKLGEFLTAHEAFASLDFDPSAKGNALFAAVGDPHMIAENPENCKLLKSIADELKSMKTPPSFCALMGDEITNGNACFASISKNHKRAVKELDMLKSCLQRFKPIRTELVLGNHDTVSPDDSQNILYRQNMPELKHYRSFDFGGAKFIVLNGGHCAQFGDEQEKWLDDEFKKLPPKAEVVVLIHQPMGNICTEYDASKKLRELFDKSDCRATIICGHIHVNNRSELITPSGKRISQLALEAPRTNRAPVYWLFPMTRGKIQNAVFRNKDGKFETFDMDFSSKKWELPFESVEVKAWFNRISKGYEEIDVKGWFNPAKCGYFYFYLKNLEVKLDLSKVGKYSELLVLARNEDGDKGVKSFAASSDGYNWTTLQPKKKIGGLYIPLSLPTSLQNGKILYFKMSFGNVGGNLGGIGVR